MNQLQAERDFFIAIAPKVQRLIESFDTIAIARHKHAATDYATEVDIAVEELIVREINRRFPNDHILAEENHAETTIPAGRIWIIDPICGTNNLARGLRDFCTNIALADNQKLIAACVIDHSCNDLLYSTGGSQVIVNGEPLQTTPTSRGQTIDIDAGCLTKTDTATRKAYPQLIANLLRETDYMLISLNTSLSFAYVASGKLDGFINIDDHPWDICAASFLIEQSGGTVTDLAGNPRTITTTGAIAACDPRVHQKLLHCYRTAYSSTA